MKLLFLIISLLIAYMLVAEEYELDSYNRVIYDRTKVEVVCPIQSKRVGVLFIAGQSNAGNHSEKMIQPGTVPNVVNYFNGKCYRASSPVLGGSLAGGEFNTLIAQHLVDRGSYDTVLLSNVSVGSSKIIEWTSDPLFEILFNSVRDVESKYDIDFFIWIHGESDNRINTSPIFYEKRFLQLLYELNKLGNFNSGITLNTHCKNYALGRNNIDIAHKKLVKYDNILELGNLNVLDNSFRYDDCHFNEKGQNSAAIIISDRIRKYLTE